MTVSVTVNDTPVQVTVDAPTGAVNVTASATSGVAVEVGPGFGGGGGGGGGGPVAWDDVTGKPSEFVPVRHAADHEEGGADALLLSVDQIAGLSTSLSSLGSSLAGKADATDARFTDAREWTASTVPIFEAEAGSSTTRRAWTAERVFQAIAAWWAASSAKTKLDGIATGATANATDSQLRDRATHTGTQLAATISDFASAALSAVTWSSLTGKPSTFSPSGHAASHGHGGTDAVSLSAVQVEVPIDSDLYTAGDSVSTALVSVETAIAGKADASHNHGNLLGDGRIGTVAGLPVITTTGGAISAGAFGTTAGTFCQGNDARLAGVPIYLQQTTPPGTGWVWFQTDGAGDVIDIITG